MINNNHIVILSNNERSAWLKLVTRELRSLGTLELRAEIMLEKESSMSFDMVIVDASGLQMGLAEQIGWLHGRFPGVPIVVLTNSPTWRRARAVLLAGAADYISLSEVEKVLLKRCSFLLNRASL